MSCVQRIKFDPHCHLLLKLNKDMRVLMHIFCINPHTNEYYQFFESKFKDVIFMYYNERVSHNPKLTY